MVKGFVLTSAIESAMMRALGHPAGTTQARHPRLCWRFWDTGLTPGRVSSPVVPCRRPFLLHETPGRVQVNHRTTRHSGGEMGERARLLWFSLDKPLEPTRTRPGGDGLSQNPGNEISTPEPETLKTGQESGHGGPGSPIPDRVEV
jgi:hypothetical protein